MFISLFMLIMFLIKYLFILNYLCFNLKIYINIKVYYTFYNCMLASVIFLLIPFYVIFVIQLYINRYFTSPCYLLSFSCQNMMLLPKRDFNLLQKSIFSRCWMYLLYIIKYLRIIYKTLNNNIINVYIFVYLLILLL